MSERGRLSVEELKQVAWRLKSLRSLTGLNQEDFSSHSDIPYMTLKGWELARALPRPDSIELIRRMMESRGIKVTAEWIIFGSGPGPIFVKSNAPVVPAEDSPHLETLVATFKKEQRSKGANPIVMTVKDSLMAPYFNKGDIVGGVYISLKDLKREHKPEQIDSQFWLTMSPSDEWVVCKIFLNNDRLFYKQINDWDIAECPSNSLGRICLHYFDTVQA